jgi:hypothetical protein
MFVVPIYVLAPRKIRLPGPSLVKPEFPAKDAVMDVLKSGIVLEIMLSVIVGVGPVRVIGSAVVPLRMSMLPDETALNIIAFALIGEVTVTSPEEGLVTSLKEAMLVPSLFQV